jgi:hypothetical protein
MAHCDVFEPLGEDARPGLYQRSSRALSYDE